ncbi:MAG: helix-turn-helix domain-containing protein [Myxococcales bacterium]|nr:helix-turn-helix domain-containing protein [Myxococcales bacterium]
MATSLVELLPLLTRLSESRDVATTLGELAQASGESPSHFQRSFARLVGESPKQLDLRLRLELAAARLVASDASILEIALAVGFDSHEGFSRAFRRLFGASPRAFRKAQQLDEEARQRHAALLTQLGPCVRLYRAPLTPTTQGDPTDMSHEVITKTLTPAVFLYQRERVTLEQIGATLAKILPHVFGYATREQIPLAGPPICRYRDFGPAYVTLEAGIPVGAGARAGDGVQVGELPGGEAAVTVHKGPYEQLREAHAAVDRWLSERGLEPAGPMWESYLTDPGQVPNPADWLTEVVWPVRPRPS